MNPQIPPHTAKTLINITQWINTTKTTQMAAIITRGDTPNRTNIIEDLNKTYVLIKAFLTTPLNRSEIILLYIIISSSIFFVLILIILSGLKHVVKKHIFQNSNGGCVAISASFPPPPLDWV